MPRATDVPTPRQAAMTLVGRLRRMGTAARRDGMRRYFKAHERVRFFGVPMPAVRRRAGALHADTKAAWGYPGALDFCARVMERPELEAKVLGLAVLHRHRRAFPPSLLPTVRRWLAADRLATWAAVDAAAPWLITPLMQRHADVVRRVLRWPAARNLWVRRAAVVAFVPLACRGERLDESYAVARALFGDSHDLLHKATGWLLREAGKTDMPRLERFLRRHGRAIPRTTVRYAIERFPPARRRALLEATR